MAIQIVSGKNDPNGKTSMKRTLLIALLVLGGCATSPLRNDVTCWDATGKTIFEAKGVEVQHVEGMYIVRELNPDGSYKLTSENEFYEYKITGNCLVTPSKLKAQSQ